MFFLVRFYLRGVFVAFSFLFKIPSLYILAEFPSLPFDILKHASRRPQAEQA
jgi:hypothetical protein